MAYIPCLQAGCMVTLFGCQYVGLGRNLVVHTSIILIQTVACVVERKEF